MTTPSPAGGVVPARLRILTNDPKSPELRLELIAQMKSPLELLPGDELAVPLPRLVATFSQTVVLRSNDEPEIKITSIRCSAPYVRCREVETPVLYAAAASRRNRAIEVSVTPDAPETAYEASIVVGTSCRRCPQVTVHVFGISRNAVTAQPPHLDFAWVRVTRSATSRSC